jgi:exonuclease III|mmetsp:Transcript_5190/g.8117  ORF Transcript_5190/g.8117 Transcript_5190/m.8117 type:complete len:284 (-) Transcript_5190:2429-3280(-)|eukprot:CAMPEP_0181348502 /NCGR_PEP_ID=MMETSP1106-20121128/211_1 /TAXON_ID=81844 /ORGANISM="Mantoniella antarctica, Strain SL-175" /LENGTH=283 /DNA_ID=CAMNT_0023460801 /DNA_START=207 /DNA_END=1058 /DNA_ORIENTATION=-
MSTLRVLSFNCGLLHVSACGITLLANPANAAARFPHVVEALLRSEADVLLLQEVYSTVHIGELLRALQPKYPHVSQHATGTLLKLNNGLLILSRFEISHSVFHGYKKVVGLERAFATKGFLETHINSPWGVLVFTNHHTTAGGLSVESLSTEGVRKHELQQAIDVLQPHLQAGRRVFLAGDLNTGPTLSPSNFQDLLKIGWEDSWAIAHPAADGFTWDNQNPLNAGNVHASSPSCRVDHIMPHKSMDLTIAAAKLLFTSEVAQVKDRMLTASDHFGLQVDFDM